MPRPSVLALARRNRARIAFVAALGAAAAGVLFVGCDAGGGAGGLSTGNGSGPSGTGGESGTGGSDGDGGDGSNVSTASITVPSSTRCKGPTALIRGVGCGLGWSPCAFAVVVDPGATGGPAGWATAPAVRAVARTTASAISSIDGSCAASRGSPFPGITRWPASGCCPSGRRLNTTLLAKRLS